ncbi:MAG: hypothetical protein COW73_04015 [Nitrospirae bacterium CG18_big_fil_WC_8_21_14_2_50_70_55]|nr:thioredoxin domain-containing protein [Deltaproteobacteria bacterium]OIP62239.1 MAG: hypothetical protein AUK30_10570 [Nitrospirae bacterium CG2_30_70_394]PIQ06175.1 MAG: hypothetical protein COW73_04015 [Nitrospirae bacterium CG18_big_fil_WC_8_21_14_2_50_70_55]PIU77435.1 MAG: hypothetical protein COS73_10580 [Nitrospirae bacterium CG06_land_8_20_14_3_00_70_43]PIW82068.1 MAG: hypothetical protein COZ96_10640 [Nitrospirae bacterium CG_4_8_14_3_um_filter_70_85]PIX82698.1 MAG: hypothetical pro
MRILPLPLALALAFCPAFACAQWLPGQGPAAQALGVKRAVAGVVYPIQAGDAPSAGPADAPVVVIEYSDFECPYCKQAHDTLKELVTRFPGKIRLVFKNHPLPNLHKHAQLAAEAALAAGAQGKFWEMHNLLFAFHDALTRADLDTYAQSLGLDLVRFNYDLARGRFRDQIERETQEMLNIGATGVPAVFVNGLYISGAKPLAVYEKAVQAALGEVEGVAADGDTADGCDDEAEPMVRR